MIVPIRCFSCGKEISSKYERFKAMKKEGKPIGEIWNALGVTRVCCKRMLTAHADVIDELLDFPRLQ